MKHPWMFSGGAMALLWSLPASVQAAGVVASTIVSEVGPLAIGIQAALILVAGIVVLACGIGAFSNFERGDMASGIFGVFKTLMAAVLLFVIIGGIIDGKMAAAASLY